MGPGKSRPAPRLPDQKTAFLSRSGDPGLPSHCSWWPSGSRPGAQAASVREVGRRSPSLLHCEGVRNNFNDLPPRSGYIKGAQREPSNKHPHEQILV
ncbi:hypothetical protein NDU88_002682 [Pleurodeles waltl]|uniref:Uncharacterized protein n=1 Tax=Pleurodeles waltl TaxID=8319 RepID=A0AAV7M4N0_PLEWA|nr:hypothetical protein NDU88_002682 [Pleurodeles waltl]